ncbi:hypothetical protein [Streptomyces sp. NPDC007264]
MPSKPRCAPRPPQKTLKERETIVSRREESGRWLSVPEHLSPAAQV